MSQDRENAPSEDIMVPEISSSTSDISETRAHHSSDDVMVATVDSSVASPISQEVDDDNSDDLIVEAGDSNDASPSISEEVSEECSNASDMIVGTTGNNEGSSSMSQEVDDESSNTGEFMIETPDSDDTSSMSQEFVDEYPNGGDMRVGTKEDSNDASPIFDEVAECSNTENIGTVEDHSIAGEISELVLTVSIANPEDLPCSEDYNISSPVTPPTQMDTSSLSVDQTKQTEDSKNNISLSPSKRRHLSSKQEPESKKPNTSKESDEELSVCNYDVKLEENLALQSPVDLPECVAEVVPQSMRDPVLGDLEPKTDTREGSTVSNDSNKTPICEVPPISGQKNPTKEIRKEKPECVAEVVPQTMRDPVLSDLEPKIDTHEGSTVSNDSNKTPICEVPPISGQKNLTKEIRKEKPECVAEVVPQSMRDPVLGDLEPKTDTREGSTVSNESNKPPICEVPPISGQKNLTKEIRKEKPECVAEVVPQSMRDPKLGDLEPKTDTREGSTVSNESNKTPICEVPPISGQKNLTKEIHKEKPKFSAFFNNIRLTWETLMEESSDQAINLSSRDIPSGSKDTSQRPFQYKEAIGGKSQFETVSAGHQPPQESTSSEISKHAEQSDLIRDTAQNSFPILLPVEIQPLTRDNFIPELESLVAEYLKDMQAETDEPIVEEQLRTFQIQYIEAINEFQGALEQTFSRIQNLELSPDMNVSSLEMISSDLLIAAVRVEKVWREFKVLLAENSDSINVINMTQHRTRCLQYFDKFILEILRYIYTLPEDYHTESES
ncbi:serine-rich adhesin for platelets-like [Parasteatoda tepidariorum]|uniref:serine-rich adhesin for platelets-like n=1 Tax=Parasteatoda tepidariorum TaxID=114398 RepID=UPI0039BD4FF2